MKKGNNIYTFNESLKVGKEGEELLKKWMLSNSRIIDVRDVRNNDKYRKADIDFLAIDDSNKQWKVEIKTDTYTTGRLCYELTSNLEHASKGCMRKCQADLLLYYFPNWERRLYVFEFPKYKDWCESNKDRLGIRFEKKTQTIGANGIPYTTECIYFYLKDLEKEHFCTLYKL